jgi:hypothetical protein
MATAKLQQGIVIQAHLTNVEAMPNGVRATMSRLAPKGKYTFVDDQGVERAVDLAKAGFKGGKPQCELQWRT